ncbi:MAG TPA: hypothetical protein VIL77_09180 [Gaiellaceae bacterium]
MSELAEGDYYGLRTGVIENEHVRLEFTLDVGPRIVRFSLRDGRNVFAETPDAEWDTVHGRPYRLLGGHRLWSSPECPLDEQVPDDAPVGVRLLDDGVELTGDTLTRDGLTPRIELRLAMAGPRVRVLHVLENHTDQEVRVAAWALTQVRPGGVAVLPLQTDELDGAQLPNRNVVLWPYSSVGDPRFELTDDTIRVAATDDAGLFKVGYLNHGGWVAYELEEVTFRKRFDPEPQAEHVDFGCNVEVYTRAEFLELETLTPLRHIAPGKTTEHVEEWELLPTA